MGRDVKRYFGDLHRFLSVGRLLSSGKGAFREAKAWPAGAGGAPAGTGKLALELERTRICGAEPRADESCLFQAATAERRGRTASLRSRVVAHRSAIEMTIPFAWIRVSLKL